MTFGDGRDVEIVNISGKLVRFGEQDVIDHANEMARDFWTKFQAEFGGTVMPER